MLGLTCTSRPVRLALGEALDRRATMDRRALLDPGAIGYFAQSHTQGALLSVINMCHVTLLTVHISNLLYRQRYISNGH